MGGVRWHDASFINPNSFAVSCQKTGITHARTHIGPMTTTEKHMRTKASWIGNKDRLSHCVEDVPDENGELPLAYRSLPNSMRNFALLHSLLQVIAPDEAQLRRCEFPAQLPSKHRESSFFFWPLLVHFSSTDNDAHTTEPRRVLSQIHLLHRQGLEPGTLAVPPFRQTAH